MNTKQWQMIPSQFVKSKNFDNKSQTGKKTRRKLWELPHKLHCPVIGTCLVTHEIEKIVDKAKVHSSTALSEYEMHVNFVAAAEELNALSLATQKFLDKKYTAAIRQTNKLKTLEQLNTFWVNALAAGEAPSALWALVTHPKSDNDLRHRLYEDIHMLSHQIGAGQRADLKRLTEAEAEIKKLQKELTTLQKKSHKQITERDKRIIQLEQASEQSKQENQQLASSEKALHQQLDILNEKVSEQSLAELEKRLASTTYNLQQLEISHAGLEEQAALADEQISTLTRERDALRTECAMMEKLLIPEPSNCDTCPENICTDCPDLEGRRILCVGGHRGLIEHYRDLVDSYNGSFEHHDGGKEDSRQRLDAMLSSADCVICATDFVSHDAYYRLKNFCKRNQKPHVLLRSSGISTFAHALNSMAS